MLGKAKRGEKEVRFVGVGLNNDRPKSSGGVIVAISTGHQAANSTRNVWPQLARWKRTNGKRGAAAGEGGRKGFGQRS